MSLDSEALETIAASFRSLADQLEILAGADRADTAPYVVRAEHSFLAHGSVFDPEHDVPPVTPKVHGTREEQDWCGIVFFGRLRALNIRQRRGADTTEQKAIGYAAGYKGRAGFNGWPWTSQDRENGRWITDDGDLTEEDKAKERISGMAFLREYAKRRGIVLPDDLA
ncbi:hypothetical protein [Frigoribacterium sp. UYMn621]|uniref:hypothetical protein n=1 Tax=Frigoribacterium sp. UYMn621 TaxID=3156343 RepID=UPI0033931966